MYYSNSFQNLLGYISYYPQWSRKIHKVVGRSGWLLNRNQKGPKRLWPFLRGRMTPFIHHDVIIKLREVNKLREQKAGEC